VKNRSSVTTTIAEPGDLHATRRGGARHEVSARVWLKPIGGSGEDPAVLEGWALNMSRGGVRVILETEVALGQEFEVTISSGPSGGEPPAAQSGRVVWVQKEPDGVVVGIAFQSVAA
jgi:hypothetical protein